VSTFFFFFFNLTSLLDVLLYISFWPLAIYLWKGMVLIPLSHVTRYIFVLVLKGVYFSIGVYRSWYFVLKNLVCAGGGMVRVASWSGITIIRLLHPITMFSLSIVLITAHIRHHVLNVTHMFFLHHVYFISFLLFIFMFSRKLTV
jgi:hypothetical protein